MKQLFNLCSSDSGHYPPMLMPNMAVYGATKFSSVLNTESLRELLALQKLPIRVTVKILILKLYF